MENEFDPKNKKVLIITAHADDADFSCGGTLIKWIDQGAKAAIVIATNGDKGTHDQNVTGEALVQLRKKEQLEASEFLGLENTWFLDYPDAHLENTQELKEKLVKIIREYQPDAVFTWDPTLVYTVEKNFINHPDHRAIGQAVLDCVYPMARDFLTFPNNSSHKVEHLFLFNFEKANYSVDISDAASKKLELLKKHTSQFSDGMKEEMEDFDHSAGEKMGVASAESFVHLTIAP
ncbi:MAG TPA: PIG-L family deacetylase [Candidatus Saccharimonadales bacterium]|nr:PIG-L family deacetylase [Candidatus Saccharimonadales bacterium]